MCLFGVVIRLDVFFECVINVFVWCCDQTGCVSLSV